MWCSWAGLWSIFWPPEGALKITIQLMHLILNLILTDGAGEISSPMTGMSFLNSAVQLINWKCRPNWDINWKFNWLINSQLKLVAIPTTDCKLWVNFAAFLWIKWHPDPWSYHGRQRMSRSCLQTFGAHGYQPKGWHPLSIFQELNFYQAINSRLLIEVWVTLIIKI